MRLGTAITGRVDFFPASFDYVAQRRLDSRSFKLRRARAVCFPVMAIGTAIEAVRGEGYLNAIRPAGSSAAAPSLHHSRTTGPPWRTSGLGCFRRVASTPLARFTSALLYGRESCSALM